MKVFWKQDVSMDVQNGSCFSKIKLPLISSTVTINIILSVISGLKAFDYSFIMTNGWSW